LPPAGWSNGDRLATGEAREWAKFVTALQEARASGADILGLASRVWFAPARREPVPVEPVIWTGETDQRILGSTKLTADQIAEAGAMLRSGMSWPKVAWRFGVSENTLRRYVTGIEPRDAAHRYPTRAVRYRHGVVRWDLPLIGGRHLQVLVECGTCGGQRYVRATHIERDSHSFTGRCDDCSVGPRNLSEQQIQEAAQLRRQGQSWTVLGERYDVNRHTVRRAVEGVAASPALL
jgi:hypothetical protein